MLPSEQYSVSTCMPEPAAAVARLASATTFVDGAARWVARAGAAAAATREDICEGYKKSLPPKAVPSLTQHAIVIDKDGAWVCTRCFKQARTAASRRHLFSSRCSPRPQPPGASSGPRSSTPRVLEVAAAVALAAAGALAAEAKEEK